MYDAIFSTTSSVGWSKSIELINADTNEPMVIEDGTQFELAVDDQYGCRRFTAGTDTGELERPTPSVVQWRFTPQQISGLRDQRTYRCGLVLIQPSGARVQIFIGSLTILDGIVSP